MKTPYITLTSEELFSLAPDVRQKLREAITPKRTNPTAITSVNMVEEVWVEDIEELVSPSAMEPLNNRVPPPGAIILEDPVETYMKSCNHGAYVQRMAVAKDSHALRAIHLSFGETDRIAGIIDGGCQIIAMSEAVCLHLALIYDPTVILNMESANGDVDPSLGIARNVPCRVGEITLYLQVHVIRRPAYDILIGRPFDVLTESIVQNFADENQTITIHDPNSHRTATVPTFPRGPPRFRLHGPPPNRLPPEKRDF
jgi:hypothetical protein